MKLTHAALALPLIAAVLPALGGPLVPPAGPVASTMKTLEQVEPRTALSQATTPGDATTLFKITQPGSYYLTGNTTAPAGKRGIRVTCDNVSIDLRGFVLQGGTGSTSGITDTEDETRPVQGLSVRNGTVRGFVTQISCDWGGTGSFKDLQLFGTNGLSYRGACVIDRCQARGLGDGTGFSAEVAPVVTHSSASGFQTGFQIEDGLVSDCVANGNQSGFGGSGVRIANCRAYQNTQYGVYVGNSTVENCYVTAGKFGISVYGLRDVVRGNTIVTPSSIGIESQLGGTRVVDNTIMGSLGLQIGILIPSGIQRCHVEGNTGEQNGFGIVIHGTNNTVVRNSFGNGSAGQPNFQFASGNRFGSVVRATTGGQTISTASTATIPGSFTTTDPFANISY